MTAPKKSLPLPPLKRPKKPPAPPTTGESTTNYVIWVGGDRGLSAGSDGRSAGGKKEGGIGLTVVPGLLVHCIIVDGTACVLHYC